MQGGASVLWNGETQNHERLIKRLLKSTKRFDCAVAFAKWSGFEPLQKVLVERLKEGMRARFIVGLDFCQSEPKVLERLLATTRTGGKTKKRATTSNAHRGLTSILCRRRRDPVESHSHGPGRPGAIVTTFRLRY
jgi:HKD family nuclease